MNYLSHYFFYHQEDAYLNTGLILPDFSRSARGRRKLLLDQVPQEPLMQSLKRGCELHYEADDWFHESAFFEEMSSFLDSEFALMEKAGWLKGQKKWFMAHIFTEMLLDRHIIDRHPESLAGFYKDLETVNLETIIDFLTFCGKEEFDSFRKHYQIFCEVKYLYKYTSDKGLAQGLDRMLRRTGQIEMEEKTIDLIAGKIPEWLNRLGEIKKVLF